MSNTFTHKLNEEKEQLRCFYAQGWQICQTQRRPESQNTQSERRRQKHACHAIYHAHRYLTAPTTCSPPIAVFTCRCWRFNFCLKINTLYLFLSDINNFFSSHNRGFYSEFSFFLLLFPLIILTFDLIYYNVLSIVWTHYHIFMTILLIIRTFILKYPLFT